MESCYKKIPGGLFSTYANEELKTGDNLGNAGGTFGIECEPEKEVMHSLQQAVEHSIISMIKAHLHSEPKSTCSFLC